MKVDVLEQSKQLLETYLREENFKYKGVSVHPWRVGGEHVFLHSLRVYSLAMKIVEGEKGKLSDDDVLMLQVAVILHDIGKFRSKEQHANRSAEIVRGWFAENPSIASTIEEPERLIRIIRNHSNKGIQDEDICSRILKDADILDEIGILSIFMASNQVDRNSPYFFNQLNKRLQGYEIDYCYKEMNKLYTETAKEILREKIIFIKGFIKQLDFELSGTEELIW